MRECRLTAHISNIARRFSCCPVIPGQCRCPCTAPQVPSTCPPAPSIPRVQGLGGFTPNPSFEFFLFSFFARLHGYGGGGDDKLAGHRASLHPSLRQGKGGKKEKGKKHPAGAARWPPPCRACRSLPRSLRGRGWAADASAQSRCPRAQGNTGTKPVLPPRSPAPTPGVLGVSRALLKQPQLPFSTDPYPSPVPCNCSLFLAGIWDGGQRCIGSRRERYQ